MSNTIQKSAEERRQIKIMKSLHKEKMKGSFFQPKEDIVQMPLIVYTKHSKVQNYKSTHSYRCFKNDISDILNNLRVLGYNIGKVYFNSKPYKYE
jgi:hypothetical protein